MSSREYNQHTMKLLLVEDDSETAAYVAKGLRELGHGVDISADGRSGLALGLEEAHDVLIVDRRLPALDGLQLVKALRVAGVRTPVLFLTTMGGVNDRVEGLEQGGDDYLVKPFAMTELGARVAALGRRPPLAGETTQLSVGPLVMNLLARSVSREGQAIDLQPVEFRLLEYLMRNPGRVVTRAMLLERVWGFNFDPRTNVVDTNISRLRAKIDKPFPGLELLKTVRGAGYCLDAPA